MLKRLRYDAVKYVLENGNPYEKLYLMKALNQSPDRNLIQEVLSLQNPDGGWPRELRKSMPSGVVATSRVLELLLKISKDKDSPIAKNAINFLLAKQREDGGWSENPELSEFISKEEAWISTTYSMTWATADVVNALIQAGFSTHPIAQKGVIFLHKTQNEEGGWNSHIGPDYPYGTDIAAMDVIVKALWLSGEDKESAAFKRAIEGVLKHRNAWKHPVCASSVLNIFLRLGFTSENPDVKELLSILIRTQRKDGGWSALEEEPTSDSGQTAYCVKQLKKCGVEIIP